MLTTIPPTPHGAGSPATPARGSHQRAAHPGRSRAPTSGPSACPPAAPRCHGPAKGRPAPHRCKASAAAPFRPRSASGGALDPSPTRAAGVLLHQVSRGHTVGAHRVLNSSASHRPPGPVRWQKASSHNHFGPEARWAPWGPEEAPRLWRSSGGGEEKGRGQGGPEGTEGQGARQVRPEMAPCD